MIKRLFSLLLLLCLASTAFAGATDEVRPLVAGQPVEREIAGGESHTYQIQIAAGQFVRFRLDQRSLNSRLNLTAPDGKQLAEINLTDAGEPESLAFEAKLTGIYELTVRGDGTAMMRGAYRLEATVQANATAQDLKYLAAQALLLEAQELNKQSPKTAAQEIEKLEQSLSIWRELGAHPWDALTLNRIGKAHSSLKQYDQAISDYEKALAIHRESHDRLGEARVLNNLADAYLNMRQFEKATESFEKSLALYREVKDRRWEGVISYNLGNTYNNLNQHEKAVAYYEQALTILREVKDQSFEAQALNNLGRVYLNRGEMEKAVATVESAVAIFREVKDPFREGLALDNLGVMYSRMGQSRKALETLELGLKLFRGLGNRAQEGNILITLGSTYGGMGEMEKAVAFFEQGLAISRELKDKSREGSALANLGLATSLLNEYEKSIGYLELALPILRDLKNRMSEGSAYSYLGISYAGLSRYEKAIESYEQALAIFREVKYKLGEGNTLMSLGNAYSSLARIDKAIEYFDQSLAIFHETKYRVGEGNALRNLGNSYVGLARYEDALRSYEQALTIFRELKYRVGEGAMLMALGVNYARLNQHEKAMGLYEQSLAIFREVKSRKDESRALFRIGESKQKLGRPDEAAAFFKQSIDVSRAIGSRSSDIAPLAALASIERARGNLSQARTLVEQCLQIAESLRADVAGTESRAALLADAQDLYQLYTDVLMRQHQAEPTKGFDALAVEASERQRARSLLDLLTEAHADVRQGVDAELIERERSLGKQLNDKAQRLTQAKPEQADALKKEISQLETDYERAQAAIRKASPHYAALTQPQPVKLKVIQAQLDADTLLLEYALGQDRSYLWAITRDSLTSYELPKVDVIERNAREVYELLAARSTNKRGETVAQRQERISEAEAKLPAAARGLSQTILAPVAGQLGNKRLVVVADGALQYIPFAMLPEPSVVSSQLSVAKNIAKNNGQPLIVKHEVVSIPSASALAIQRSELAGRQVAPKMLAVIADPVFDASDSRFTAPATETAAKTQTRTIDGDDARSIEHLREKSGDKPGATTIRMVIPRLPFTRQEANQLMALAPKGSSFEAIDFQATRATALDPALSQYRYVHIATHGLLDTERPGLSALVFSMVDAEGKPQNGFLRANDIYNLQLPAELVVLSACQTGLGKEIKGEGLVGLTRGFMYAGAARVVVSLWNVNDKATADLMTKFYEKMLKQGQPPAAALRAAQVEMWKQKQWQSPYYWAAFTMQGEWR